MIVGFGRHANCDVKDVPVKYMCWLAKPTRYYLDSKSPEVTFKVPLPVQLEARRILEERGHIIIGERIEDSAGNIVYERR
jgi:hypothetical protein